MALTKYDLEQLARKQQLFGTGPMDPMGQFGVNPSGVPGELDLENSKKVQIPGWSFTDTFIDPTKISAPEKTITDPNAAKPKPTNGWGGIDTIEEAPKAPSSAYTPPFATSGAGRPSASWLSFVGNTYNAAIDYVHAFTAGEPTAKEAPKTENKRTAEAESSGIMGSIYAMWDRLAGGIKQMSSNVWYLVAGAEKAFENGEKTYTVPDLNPDGTPNAFAGRKITPSDLKDLSRFHHDTQELMDILSKLEGDIGIEGIMLLLLKVLSKDKDEKFDYLQKKLQKNHRELNAVTKKRMEQAEELAKKIKDNQWSEWFNEALAHGSLAVSGALLIPAAMSASSLAVPMIFAAITLGTAGLLDDYIGVYSGMANAWSKTIGSDSDTDRVRYRNTIKSNARYLVGISAILVPLMGIQLPSVGAGGNVWGFGATLGNFLNTHAATASGKLNSIAFIGQHLGNAAQTFGNHSASLGAGLESFMNTFLRKPFVTHMVPHGAAYFSWLSTAIGTYVKTSTQVETGEVRGRVDYHSDKVKQKEEAINSTLKALNGAFEEKSNLFDGFLKMIRKNADVARQLMRRH